MPRLQMTKLLRAGALAMTGERQARNDGKMSRRDRTITNFQLSIFKWIASVCRFFEF